MSNSVINVRALAYDAAGNLSFSPTLNLEVLNDYAEPTVSFTYPGPGATLQGTVLLTAEASDDVRVSYVVFHAGTTLLGTRASAPYTFAWNTLTFANGAVRLSATVYDVAGKSSTSTVDVRVLNDLTAPTVRLTAPTAGASVSRTVTLSATASDDQAVTRVEFYAGGTLVGTDTSAPYSVTWDSTRVANGTYSLTVKAYDAAGNEGTGPGVSVTVKNGGKV
jgi:hypothetical protein